MSTQLVEKRRNARDIQKKKHEQKKTGFDLFTFVNGYMALVWRLCVRLIGKNSHPLPPRTYFNTLAGRDFMLVFAWVFAKKKGPRLYASQSRSFTPLMCQNAQGEAALCCGFQAIQFHLLWSQGCPCGASSSEEEPLPSLTLPTMPPLPGLKRFYENLHPRL